MTTTDIQKAVKEIDERWQGKFIDSQTFADLRALLFATKALLSSADVDRDVIQRQEKMIGELTASNGLLLRQRDTWQAECERLQGVVSSMSTQIVALEEELAAYREQADKPEDIAELARQVARYAGAFRELAKTKQERDRLKMALESLMDEQNGPPLLDRRHKEAWEMAMEEAREATGRE